MQKLPKSTLELLNEENKQSLREVISSWNKENFRNAIWQILDEWWDINEIIEKLYNLEKDIGKIFFNLLHWIIAEKSKYSFKYAEYLVDIIKNKKIYEEKWRFFNLL